MFTALRTVVLISLFFVVTAFIPTHAEGFLFGYSPVISLHSVSDEDSGDSENQITYSLLSASAVVNLDWDSDIKFNADYIDTDFDASTTNVGQDVSGISISGIWRNRIPMSRHFKPWLGVGLSIDQIDYVNRYTVDGDGFLARSFTDRSETDLSLLLSTSLLFGNERSRSFEADLTYKIPFDKGLEGISLRLTYFPGFLNGE